MAEDRVKRGEVWTVTFHPRSGSEQAGTRPAVILSNDGFNLAPGWGSIIVIPISSSGNQKRRPDTAISLPSGTGGLSRDSFALCHQITTVDRSKFTQRLGSLDSSVLAEIEEGVKAALDFPL